MTFVKFVHAAAIKFRLSIIPTFQASPLLNYSSYHCIKAIPSALEAKLSGLSIRYSYPEEYVHGELYDKLAPGKRRQSSCFKPNCAYRHVRRKVGIAALEERGKGKQND